MNELTTKAIVLSQHDSGDLDSIYMLYTQKLGLVKAIAKSTKKPTSKLSGHLQPLNLIEVRLVNKNFFRITDALLIKNLKVEIEKGIANQKERTKKLREVINIFSMIQSVAQPEQVDDELYRLLESGKIFSKNILQVLGLDPDHSICAVCETPRPKHFLIKEMEYLCNPCLQDKASQPKYPSRLAV